MILILTGYFQQILQNTSKNVPGCEFSKLFQGNRNRYTVCSSQWKTSLDIIVICTQVHSFVFNFHPSALSCIVFSPKCILLYCFYQTSTLSHVPKYIIMFTQVYCHVHPSALSCSRKGIVLLPSLIWLTISS